MNQLMTHAMPGLATSDRTLYCVGVYFAVRRWPPLETIMSGGQTVLLACQISPSGFSGERVFRITLVNDTEYIGVAPVDYCRRRDRSAIGPSEPAKGKRINGFFEGRVLENGEGEARVALPDGEVIMVPIDRISFVSETRETTYVPVGS